MSDLEGLNADQLRTELRFAYAENIRLQDTHSVAMRDHRAEVENARQAERINAMRRADVYAQSALRNLLDPLRRLLTQVGEIDEKTLPDRLQQLAEQARDLAKALDRDPDVKAAQRVIADMETALRRVTSEKARLWDMLQAVLDAVRSVSLAELREQEYQHGTARGEA